jgi:hypothetical protein
MPRHKPADTLEIATAQECLRDALRLALAGPATWRPDNPEGVDAARARFARLTYSGRLDMICCASRAVCLALYADLSAAAARPRVVEV